RPSTTPAAAPIATAIRPTAIDARAPAITRASTSRPYWSVPNGCAADGGCNRNAIDMASGSLGVQTTLTAAIATSASVSTAPSANVTCRHGPRCVISDVGTSCETSLRHERCRLVITDARIEREVSEVDEEIDGDDRGGDEDGDALDHRQIARGDRAEREAAEAGEREHRLEDDAAGEQLAELQPRDRDDRDQRVAKRVLGNDDAFVHTFGPRRPHVVLTQDVEHRRARGTHEHGGLEHAERERG